MIWYICSHMMITNQNPLYLQDYFLAWYPKWFP
jgi:hypothetical protein